MRYIYSILKLMSFLKKNVLLNLIWMFIIKCECKNNIDTSSVMGADLPGYC